MLPGPVRRAYCAALAGVFLLGVLTACPASQHVAAPEIGPTEAGEPQYLLFWRAPDQVPALLKAVGTRGDARHVLGFGFPIPTIAAEKQVPALIHAAFATARAQDVALMLHFDFHIAWENRPDLWNWFDPKLPGYSPANRANVEWFGWDGPPSRVRYLNHGVLKRMAPPMCFTSRRIRAEWARLVRDVIAPTLRWELAALTRAGKRRLFAGVLVGSEPMIDNYSRPDAETARLIQEDGTPRGRLGYRALMDRGFSKDNPPSNLTNALSSIIQETVSYWCHLFAASGIPTNRLYTHVAAQPPAELEGVKFSAAFNPWSRPGWTTYAVMQLGSGFKPLYRELRKHAGPPWGGVEANAGIPGSTVDWETYLGWHYNHGAVLVGVNMGATGTDLPARLESSAFSPEAIEAYRKFLSGAKLTERAVSASRPDARLQKRMLALRAAIQSWQKAGRDPSPIVLPMQERLPALLRAGRYNEAEMLVNEVLRRLSAK